MTKQELSERIAELYGIEPAQGYVDKSKLGMTERWGKTDYGEDLIRGWLIDDTARMFELAVEHEIFIECWDTEAQAICWAEGISENFSFKCYHQDHPTKLEATLWAIGLALVKKGESK
jgi:hypothetical protein